MEGRWLAFIAIVLIMGGALGFAVSRSSGIQPGYFEKQEAPAYGSSETKAIGSEFGKEFEDLYKELYKKE